MREEKKEGEGEEKISEMKLKMIRTTYFISYVSTKNKTKIYFSTAFDNHFSFILPYQHTF